MQRSDNLDSTMTFAGEIEEQQVDAKEQGLVVHATSVEEVPQSTGVAIVPVQSSKCILGYVCVILLCGALCVGLVTYMALLWVRNKDNPFFYIFVALFFPVFIICAVVGFLACSGATVCLCRRGNESVLIAPVDQSRGVIQ